MQLNFVNGNEFQKSACRTAAHNLLHLPFASIPLTVNVEFVPDPVPGSDDEFAVTSFTYDSPESTIQIDKVAPDWAHPYKGVLFLQETFAHELAHSFFAALPESRRVAIAKMFGAKSDNLKELSPSGSAWVNRIIEGIAETFKDAFLPQRFRQFSNRTNRRISISRYPAFRALWRQGFETPGESLPSLSRSWSSQNFNSYLCDDSVLSQFGATHGEPFHFTNEVYDGYDFRGLAWTEGSFSLDHRPWLKKVSEVTTSFVYNHDKFDFEGTTVYIRYGDEFGTPLPQGSLWSVYLKLKIRAVWLMTNGSLQVSTEEYNIEEECIWEVFVSEPPSVILDTEDVWQIANDPAHFGFSNIRHRYNDVENPKFKWSIPSGAQAFAGVVIGDWHQRELIPWGDGDGFYAGHVHHFDFELLTFTTISGATTPGVEMEDILAPAGAIEPGGQGGGRVRTPHSVRG